MPSMPMHPALWRLMRLRVRGGLRLTFRGLRTPKGALYAVVMAGLMVLWLGPSVVTGLATQRGSADFVRTVTPPGMLAMLVLNLLTVKPGSGIAFRPAEVDFLFPAPFPRRDLLVFKLVELLAGSLGMALMLSVFLLPYVAFWGAGFVGYLLAMSFLMLFPLCLSLLAATVTERAYTTGRKSVLLGVVTAAGIGVFLALSSGGTETTDALTLLNRWRSSWTGFLILAPFEVFGRTVGAERWFPDLLGWGSVALAMNAGLVLLVLRLDADYMEASAETARKMYERLQQMRQGTVWWSSGWKSASRIRLPAPPWLGGAGPIAWRQLLTALRGIHGWLLIVLLLMAAGTLPLMFSGAMQRMAVGVLSVLGVTCAFYLPMFIAFDFRADVDRIDLLKSLPISGTALVTGQLLAPVIITTLIQLVPIVGFGIAQPNLAVWLLIATAFLVPVNFVVYAVENLVFLTFPYRLFSAQMDPQAMARLMLIMFLKFAILGLLAGLAAGAGGAAWFLFGGSPTAFVSVSWLTLTGLSFGLVPIVLAAYRRFDPSTDTPP